MLSIESQQNVQLVYKFDWWLSFYDKRVRLLVVSGMLTWIRNQVWRQMDGWMKDKRRTWFWGFLRLNALLNARRLPRLLLADIELVSLEILSQTSVFSAVGFSAFWSQSLKHSFVMLRLIVWDVSHAWYIMWAYRSLTLCHSHGVAMIIDKLGEFVYNGDCDRTGACMPHQLGFWFQL